MADTRPERRFTRIDRLPPYVFNITAELKMAARRRGEDIIDFSMGNPDGATPPHIVEKLCTVAQRPDTHGYSTSRGIPRLRRAISRWYQDRYDVEIDPESEAIVTIGSKEGLAHLMLATLDHGDTVLVPNPSYPIHIYGAVIAGAQVRSVPLVEGVDFFNELERAIRESYPKPKMMILGFPSNPTAQCVELEFFEKVVALAKRYDVLVVHDLAYADIVYDGWKAPSIMQVPGARDVAVEGEVGVIGGVEEDISADHDKLAEYDETLRYLTLSGIDAIAPAVGTAHGVYTRAPEINYALVERLARGVMPVVVHGGTGLSDDVFRRLVACGAAKINISTAVKISYLEGVRKAAEQNMKNPLDADALIENEVCMMARRIIRLFANR